MKEIPLQTVAVSQAALSRIPPGRWLRFVAVRDVDVDGEITAAIVVEESVYPGHKMYYSVEDGHYLGDVDV